ncbi:MAG: hypothetical protein HOC74_35495 [Gemmatimonadetes bacterium]|jgi:hypothetical protein|nr:hypothetical protein [Gemmatimonadota bacterium]
MADKQRFDLFARFILERYGCCRVYDIAGGMGMLNQVLTELGCETTTFDTRHKHLPVRYEQRRFSVEEPCAADVVVGMHPDGATRVIVDYAARWNVPFAVVPCCSDNGMPYKSWMRFLGEYAVELGLGVEEHSLPMRGRARVLIGVPREEEGSSTHTV